MKWKTKVSTKLLLLLLAVFYTCFAGNVALAEQQPSVDIIVEANDPTETNPTPVQADTPTANTPPTITPTTETEPTETQPVETPEPEPTYSPGWNRMDDGNWKYYRNGSFVASDWVLDEGRYYYLDEAGNMHKGWLKLNGRAYYLHPNSGAMQTGTVNIGGQNEEFAESGRYLGPKRAASYTGWAQGGPDGNWYYIRKGAITRGWQQVNKSWYYMKADGVMATEEWASSGNKWYFMNANGTMAQGWKKVEDEKGDARWYFFTHGTGVMKTGWLQSAGGWYYLRGNGMLENTWLKQGNSWYFFTPGGRMATGWAKVEGSGSKPTKWYYFSPGSGIMRTGWFENGGNWYYLQGDGSMTEESWYKINNRWYYFRPGGRMAQGWTEVDSTWYYLKSGSGTMHTGWFESGGNWYYLRGDGSMTSGFIRIGINWYYFNGNGIMQRNWTQVDGKWYYFKSDGTMVSGKYNIGGKDHYFTVDGEWIDYGNVSKGIDVSAWQEDINWKDVKDSGMADFVILRALRVEPTAGPNGTPRRSIDPYFETNMRQAKAQGIKVGAYLVTYAFNREEMKQEVEMFVNSDEIRRLKAEGLKFDFPVFIDIEYSGILTGNPSYESRTDVLRYGMDLLRQYGYVPGFYSNINWANNYYNASKLCNEGYYFWLARYPGDPYQKPEDKPKASDIKNAVFAMWQYTNAGLVNGIHGLVDMNFGYTNF